MYMYVCVYSLDFGFVCLNCYYDLQKLSIDIFREILMQMNLLPVFIACMW